MENKPTSKKMVKATKNLPAVSKLPSLVPLEHEKQIEFFEMISKSANTSIKTAVDAILVYETCRNLGVNWATGIQRMFIIQNKLSLDIHLIKGVLSRPTNNVFWERVKSFEPSYLYITKDKRTIKQDDLPKGYKELSLYEFSNYSGNDFVVTKKLAIEDHLFNGIKISVGEPIIYNYTTEYIFYRERRLLDGSIFKIVESDAGKFSWIDAVKAQLPINKSGNFDFNSAWYKYTKQMIDHRAFKFGAYAIGSDLLAGCDEITEVLDYTNQKYDLTEDGEVILEPNENPDKD